MANFNFNRVIIGGRLAENPELKTTPAGATVCSVKIAVNRKTKSGETPVADFFTITAWRDRAEFLCKYFTKGSSIHIEGTLQTKTWTGIDGAKHYGTDIVVDNINFVDSKNEYTQVQAHAQPTVTYNSGDLEDISGEELPF